MEKRTVGIVATIITILLCGCPGLLSLCMGAVITIPGLFPNFYGTTGDAAQIITMGVVGICVGVVMVAIPIIIGVVTIRLRNETKPSQSNLDEPLPPAL